ncbi:hypothetical protein CRG98_010825 [Punica granatum]|uniref:Uncharacterized protein n=1 Tax=Punica granatum TaxID=22663 RepID=A0A2I0KJU7_PUNGR|nr:hypothetical protein CRG98_010825 [Punica granatum]
MMRSSCNGGAQTDIGIHPTSGNDRAQLVYQSGWSDRGGFEQAGQDLNWLRTKTPRPQPFMNHPPRPATRPIEIDFFGPPGMLRQQQSQPSTSGGPVENESGSCDAAAQRDRKGKAIMRADDPPRVRLVLFREKCKIYTCIVPKM